MPRVDEQERREAVPPKERPCDLVERAGRVLATPRVPVTRQVDEIQRHAALTRDAVDIRQPRLARRRTRARNAPANERVDQARLADVRTPHQGNLGQIVLREVARSGGAYDEISVSLQWVIVSSTIASTGSACAASGRRPASGSTSAIFRTSSIVWTM